MADLTRAQAVGAGSGTLSAGTRELVLIDDDDLSREVMAMVATDAGFAPESFPSGEAALVWLRDRTVPPAAVLTDMQMPGISGAELAVWLREACGPRTLLLAMSGSPISDEAVAHYDRFLLKPFSSDQLARAFAGSSCETPAPPASTAVVLDLATYDKLGKSMPATQLASLYQMCIDDAARRIALMRTANAAHDDAAYRGAAHAIKGGCSMVGALELSGMASAMEQQGLPATVRGAPDDTPLDQFLTASNRLGRMLETKASGTTR